MITIRAGTIDVKLVLPFIPDQENKFTNKIEFLPGYFVGVSSVRLKTFKIKGITCVTCGLIGEYFAIETSQGTSGYHLNLYAIKEDVEIMMTKDHIIPKSKGGTWRLSNMQPMCAPCNVEKGDKIIKKGKTCL